jgi:predicted ArsR family transcriptional regulator
MSTDPPAAPALGESKARVLAALQDSPQPLGVTEVAECVGLHPNTTRFHLDALVDAGLAERGSEAREHPGRPRTLYSAAPGSVRTGQRSYRLLAQILVSYVANEAENPGRVALEAGEEWGRHLTERPAPFERVDAAGASDRLVERLDEIGFAPEAMTSGRKRRVLLHHCPFREAAEQNREVVCSVHLGLMRGLLAELDAPIEAQRLDPFVEPSLCVTHLAAANRSPRAGTSRRTG